MKKEQTTKKMQLNKQTVAMLSNSQAGLDNGFQAVTIIIVKTNPPGSCAGSVVIVGACGTGTVVEV